MYNTLFDIEQKNRFLTEEGLNFSILYFKPTFKDNIIFSIKSNADKETWNNNLIGELQILADYENKPGWVDRVERTVDLYFDGTY